MSRTPLNGTKTHPLTEVAKEALREIARSPVPRTRINPGLVNRLRRGELVESVMLPSPFKTHKGREIEHLAISDKGRDVIEGG